MTTLYRPVLIESAEQAEALPEGTLAYLEHSTSSPDALDPSKRRPFVARSTASKATNDWWLTSGNARSDAEMVGWSALVPIEAEEEHVAPDAITYSRYVTAWEEA